MIVHAFTDYSPYTHMVGCLDKMQNVDKKKRQNDKNEYWFKRNRQMNFDEFIIPKKKRILMNFILPVLYAKYMPFLLKDVYVIL